MKPTKNIKLLKNRKYKMTMLRIELPNGYYAILTLVVYLSREGEIVLFQVHYEIFRPNDKLLSIFQCQPVEKPPHTPESTQGETLPEWLEAHGFDGEKLGEGMTDFEKLEIYLLAAIYRAQLENC